MARPTGGTACPLLKTRAKRVFKDESTTRIVAAQRHIIYAALANASCI